MDLDILLILSNKYNYNNYIKYIKDYNINPETKIILEGFNKYYKQDNTVEDIDFNDFETWFFLVAHPTLRVDKAKLYRSVITALKSHTISAKLKEQVIKSFIGRDYATRIADTALRVAEGDSKADIEDIPDMVQSYHKDIGKTSEIEAHFVSEDIDEILDATYSSGGVNWRLKPLNESVGPLRKGNFVVFGARPDAGKTTWLASEATFIAPQLADDEVVLWINNEEEGKQVRSRIIQAAVGKDIKTINANRQRTMEEYDRLVGRGKIRVVDKSTISVGEIDELLNNMSVGLIIFDQLWKIHGFEKEASLETHRQTMLFSQAREWAKMYCPVITVTQADGSAEGERWIEQNQLYGSKTGIQGESDVIINLGRTHEAGYERSRFLYVPKNKLPGGPNTNPAMKNGKYEIIIQPEIARFKS